MKSTVFLSLLFISGFQLAESQTAAYPFQNGVVRTEYKVTVYPQAIGMAAGCDVEAIKQMGDYTAEEGRAIYNTAQAKKDYRIYHGLTYRTPNINIWGNRSFLS